MRFCFNTPMTESLDHKASTVQGLGWVVGFQLALWTLVPTLVNQNLPLDVVEAIAWGHEWQWGYDKHPPLSGWLAEAAAVIGGGDWALYLLSQLCVCLAFVGVYKLCDAAMGSRKALMATLLMQGVTYHQFTSPEFNVNVAQLPCWAWAYYFFWRALKQNKLLHWVMIGVCVGLGILSKYLAGLIVFPLLLFPILSKPHRRIFRGPGMYVSMGVTVLVVMPHVVWGFANDWITLTYGVRRAGGNAEPSVLDHLINPLDFVAAQLLAGVGMIPILWVWGLRRRRVVEERGVQREGATTSRCESGADLFLTTMALTPMTVFCLLSLVTGFELRSMWGTPLLLLWGAVLVSRFEFVSIRNPKILWLPPVIVSLLMAGLYAGCTLTSLSSRDKGKRTNFDGAAFAEAVEARWQSETDEPLLIVIGGPWEAGNTGHYLEERPTAYLYGDPARARWMTDDDVREHGAMIVWTKADRADAPPEAWERSPVEKPGDRFGAVKKLADLIQPWSGDETGELAGGGMRFGVWLVRPAVDRADAD